MDIANEILMKSIILGAVAEMGKGIKAQIQSIKQAIKTAKERNSEGISRRH